MQLIIDCIALIIYNYKNSIKNNNEIQWNIIQSTNKIEFNNNKNNTFLYILDTFNIFPWLIITIK